MHIFKKSCHPVNESAARSCLSRAQLAAVRTHASHSVQTALKMEGYCCPSFSKKSAKSFVKKICPKKRKLSSDLEVIGNDQNNENWPPEGRPTKKKYVSLIHQKISVFLIISSRLECKIL